jgi:hypothetical protein
MKEFVPLEDVESGYTDLVRFAIWGGARKDNAGRYLNVWRSDYLKREEKRFLRKVDEPSHIYIVKKGESRSFYC